MTAETHATFQAIVMGGSKRELGMRSFAEELMAAEADVICGAPYGEISVDRVNRRNGYRSANVPYRPAAQRHRTLWVAGRGSGLERT